MSWHNRDWIREAAKRADVVTVTTPSLLKRYGFGHGVVIPNFGAESYLTVVPEVRRQAVGWGGSVGTHPGDLDVTKGAISQALSGTEWGFHVIGTGAGGTGIEAVRGPFDNRGMGRV